jgi:aerobic-type carbon monoxide dehydrogenase small subunit (CoxS/CutS family)
MSAKYPIKLSVNGISYEREVEGRRLLVDFIRDDLGLTGTHIGCELGECGTCTIILNGQSVKSCLMFAVEADGAEILTIEGLSQDPENLHPIQKAFLENFAVQCGFCSPGMVLSAYDLLARIPSPNEQQIRKNLSGNICRCTGYDSIVKAIGSLT